MAVLSTPDRSEAPRVSRPKAVVLASNNVWPNVGDALKAVGACVGYLDPVCGGGEHMAHLVREQAWVVIDQEQAGHLTRASTQW